MTDQPNRTVVNKSSFSKTGGSTAKLLNSNLSFSIDNVNHLLLDQKDFTVIGVIGMEGTGKSTLLNHLVETDGVSEAPFATQSEETYYQGTHETVGIDLTVTSDRFIFLDSQAVLSASILAATMKSELPLPPDVISYENLQEVQSIKLAALMFSICHVVIIVSENIDLHFWKFIRTVEMLKYRIPNIASPNLSLSSDHDENSEYYPDIVFAFTKQEDHNFSPKQSKH
eukprot:CAMPEP_0174259672 /NCGR_PEP_ID=MMETSP0439-20130205/8481_1 /TAXON_ID=0 /ORGANISM="Stereomyxa ramosa, Strain Chinc5" /LENGTH=226 /DNA_ID=CAMNT_0015343659 /DNA_START=154 /DNA_END=835 /DNA_ORIENTATION=-